MAMNQQQQRTSMPTQDAEALEEAFGPGIFASAMHNKVPETAWEYHIRKSLNDAAYNSLEYVPYCSTMPVQQKCDEPKFMWVLLLETDVRAFLLGPHAAMSNHLYNECQLVSLLNMHFVRLLLQKRKER